MRRRYNMRHYRALNESSSESDIMYSAALRYIMKLTGMNISQAIAEVEKEVAYDDLRALDEEDWDDDDWDEDEELDCDGDDCFEIEEGEELDFDDFDDFEEEPETHQYSNVRVKTRNLFA